MFRRAIHLVVGLTLGSGAVIAQIPPEERIPISDPDRLAAMRFPRDAKNVYVWSKADLKGESLEGEPNFDPKETESWGSAVGYTTVLAYEVQGYYEVLQHWSRNLLETQLLDNSSPQDGYVKINAPDGAKLISFGFWAYDTSPTEDMTFRVWQTCQPWGTGDPVSTLVAENSTLGAIGNSVGSKSLGGLTVNNVDCGYTTEIVFPAIANPGETVSLRKLRFTWARQVSPAPASATFTDVPTSHPFFQFVEALAKSGVTAGCGGGNSKALGLQWP